MTVEVRAHDKRKFQPGASIHLEWGGGGGNQRAKKAD